jgi:hypothetical protein
MHNARLHWATQMVDASLKNPPNTEPTGQKMNHKSTNKLNVYLEVGSRAHGEIAKYRPRGLACAGSRLGDRRLAKGTHCLNGIGCSK